MLKHIARVVKNYKKTLNVEKLYTTTEAAKLAGISRQTLQMWIVAGRIKAPEVLRPLHLRLWTSEDVAQLKQVKRKRFSRKPGRRPRQEGAEGREVNANT
jgi:excisionase family DNA binding protein